MRPRLEPDDGRDRLGVFDDGILVGGPFDGRVRQVPPGAVDGPQPGVRVRRASRGHGHAGGAAVEPLSSFAYAEKFNRTYFSRRARQRYAGGTARDGTGGTKWWEGWDV